MTKSNVSSKIFKGSNPLPKRGSGRPRSIPFDYKKLTVGQYFVAGKYTSDLVARINNNNYYYARTLNRKFSIRKGKSMLLVYRTM